MSQRKPNLLIYILTGLIAVWFVGCAEKVITDEDIVASWDGGAITVKEFKDLLIKRWGDEFSASKQPLEMRQDVLKNHLDDLFVIIEARRRGVDKRTSILKSCMKQIHTIKMKQDEAAEPKAVELLFNKLVRDRIFDVKTVRKFWEHDKEEVRARHILIAIPPEVTGKDTIQYWNLINEIYDKARSGEEFTDLVDRYSDDTSIDKKDHGDLGFFEWGRMVDEFQDAAWKLEPGEISPIIRTRFGYHLIKLLDRQPRNLEINTSHIYLKCSRRADPAETTAAWDRATMILKKARSKGADFAKLARLYSEDYRTWTDSEAGYQPKNLVQPEYWEKVRSMKKGQIDGPVRTRDGFYVIKVNGSRINDKSIDDPEERNRVLVALAQIYQDVAQQRVTFFIDSVKSLYQPKINPETMEHLKMSLGNQDIPDTMTQFDLFTDAEKELTVVDDNMGGFKIKDLVQKFSEEYLPKDQFQDPSAVDQLIDQFMASRYLIALADKMVFFDHPDVIEAGNQQVERILQLEMEYEMGFADYSPTDDEIKEYYEKNHDEFVKPAKATVWEILVDDKQFADSLYKRIENGEKISRLARRYSQRWKALKKEGKLGPFTIDQYGPVSRKAFELKVGDIAGPIEHRDGFSIIQLEEMTPEQVRTLEKVSNRIKSDLRSQYIRDSKRAWIENLKKTNHLTINEDAVVHAWRLVDPLPQAMIEERNKWQEERRKIGALAKRDRGLKSQIELPFHPGTEQTYERDGKTYKVKIGEPRYQSGEKVDNSEVKVKPKPGNVLELKPKDQGSQKPVIKLKPKPKKD